jgi:arylsulfatase A-like enzyme
MVNNHAPKNALFIWLLFLTCMFVLLEISFALQGSNIYLGDFEYISRHLAIPRSVLPAIFFFVFAQTLLHLVFTLLVWAVARITGNFLNWSWLRIEKYGFSLWVLALLTVMMANQYYFPNSKFAELTATLVPVFLVGSIFWISLLLILANVSFALLAVFFNRKYLLLTIPLSGLLIWFVLIPTQMVTVADAGTVQHPNIILIGVDSLRPDFISQQTTPHMQSFLQNAVIFSETYTPLARTFPAWGSLLTGMYPKHNGIRYDLINQKSLALGGSLPALLRAQGYKTIYAMDETRFSNMDKNFGFDKIITPPAGFNDFLLGTFNDFPLSNLVINTRVGHWLFPYSYANRPAYITYQPDSFLHLLQPELAQNRNKPLFIAVHFCLPHFPYFWANYSPLHSTQALVHYRAAIARSDQQVGDLLHLLQQDGLLKHSIVLLLSDHGEGLELDGDRITDVNKFIAGAANSKHVIPRFYPPSFDFEKVNQAAGHGTDVLGLSQYHSVLAFRFYGVNGYPAKNITARVSLMDIKPTLLTLLHIPGAHLDGRSLLPYFAGVPSLAAASDFFIESDFSPVSIRTVHPELRKVMLDGLDFFQIDPVTTHLTVKKEMGELIISSKQYADIYGEWVLALYPQQLGNMMPILVNLQTGRWTNDLHTKFAQQSPATHMLQAMQKFYGDSISKIVNG